MLSMDIVIPSKWRKDKLDKCLNSIFVSSNTTKASVNLWLYLTESSEYQHYWAYFQGFDAVRVCILPKYRVPDFWNAHLGIMTSDVLVYVNDDIEFFEDTIEMIAQEYPAKFPDNDGVMGLRQANLPQDQAVEGAFGVIGRKYAERFPDGQVFCPDYDRFYGDFELWQFAKSINKFYFCTTARIQHHHPSTNRALEDATHKDVRKYIAGDRQVFEQRKARGLLWGKSFDLITTSKEL